MATHRQSEPTGNARITSPVSAGCGPGPSSRTSSLNAADQPSQACSSTDAIRPWLEDGTERGSGDNAEEDQEETALLEALHNVQLSNNTDDLPLGFTGKVRQERGSHCVCCGLLIRRLTRCFSLRASTSCSQHATTSMATRARPTDSLKVSFPADDVRLGPRS